ncbi:MAG: transposase, partial [Taibaiella sp.]|nr:transposase [Taibaiella sp.]
MPLPDKEKITKACIDDFAFKKRHAYGTILVDIDTHRVIDLLDSREIDAVAEWLKTYTSLEIVSRDGSVSYNSAIKQANEDIVQISDRFHLLKGLTDASKKYITGLVTANFGVPASASHYDGTVSTDYWDKETKEDFPTREHNASCEKKINLANKARKLEEQGYKPGRIAEELGISYPSVKRYLSPDFNPVHGLYNTTTNSKIKPYADAIKEMLGKGRTFKEIEVAIREDGYDGAASTIRMFTTRERKLLMEAKVDEGGHVEKIERKWLIRLLYKPVNRVKEITQA